MAIAPIRKQKAVTGMGRMRPPISSMFRVPVECSTDPAPRNRRHLKIAWFSVWNIAAIRATAASSRMPGNAENQSRAQTHENDADILDAVVGQKPFEIMLHQGIQDAKNGRDDSDDEHQQARPGRHSSQRIQENAGHAIDPGF